MTPKYEGLGRKLTIESRNEKLGRYFLGHLSEEENNRLEQDTAVDPVSFEKAQIFESELIDEYLRDDLSASDRKAFRTSYLRGDGRREKLASSASLWSVANEQQTRVFAGGQKTSPKIWRLLSGWPAFAGFAAIVFFGTLVYVAFKSGLKVEVSEFRNPDQPIIGITKTEEPQANSAIEPQSNNAAQQPPNNAAGTNTADNSNFPPRDNTVKDKPKEKGTLSPAVASFSVLPGALRDEGEQSIKITPKTRSIDLRMTPPTDASKYRSYSVTVKTADGETVFAAPNLGSLRFTVPASKLENRTYIIFLEGLNTQNTPESVAEYTFRVRR